MKRKLLIAVPLLALVAVAAWFFRPKHESLGEGYVSEKSVTLWSSMAQVREPLGVLHYGDRVDMLAKRNDFVKVKNGAGAVGWVDGRLLMDPALWQRSEELLKRAESLPVQASGRTKVATNLRVDRGARLRHHQGLGGPRAAVEGEPRRREGHREERGQRRRYRRQRDHSHQPACRGGRGQGRGGICRRHGS